MASLVEELISTLQEEENIYKKLLPIAESKSKAVIDNDLQELETITQQEQEYIDRIGILENKREENVRNMGVVLNRNPKTLNLQGIIDILQKQPEEQAKLRTVHDELKETVGRLKDINAQNRILIQDSLEMIEFNLNLIRSTRMSTGSSNYSKDASQIDAPDSQSNFDAKQ